MNTKLMPTISLITNIDYVTGAGVCSVGDAGKFVFNYVTKESDEISAAIINEENLRDKIYTIRGKRVMHDRFIVLDYGTDDGIIYHCGGSSKDAGEAVTAIAELKGDLTKRPMDMVVGLLLKNPELKLR